MASEIEVEDGPNDDGEMYQRPGKITDKIPKPYPNEQAARSANNRALPVDLSLVVKARTAQEDYVFALLTGYKSPPAGVVVKEGQYYNPYFPGSKIAMPQQLHPGALRFDDGTEASISQMAKDTSTFLAWAAEPTLEERKRIGFKYQFLVGLLLIPFFYWKRAKWSTIKTRKISFIDKKWSNSSH